MARMSLEKTDKMLQGLAAGIDSVLNGKAAGEARKNAFVLLVTDFRETGSVGSNINYVSNADRASVITMLRDIIDRHDAQKKLDEAAPPSAAKN